MTETFRPSRAERSRSNATVLGSFSTGVLAAFFAAAPGALDSLARRSVSRTESPLSTTFLARRSGASALSRARAWPALSLPSVSSSRTGSDSFSRRSVLAMWLRLLPMTFDSASWV